MRKTALGMAAILLAMAGIAARADFPSGTTHYYEGPTVFTVINKEGSLTLLASGPGLDNFEASITTEADRTKVPGNVMATFRLACVHKEFDIPEGDEWNVLGPRIMKVIKLQMWSAQAYDAQPQRVADAPIDPDSPLAAPAKNLKMVLEGRGPDSELKTVMMQYRDALKKVRDDLQQSQNDLKKVLTIRQEAILMKMGVLP